MSQIIRSSSVDSSYVIPVYMFRPYESEDGLPSYRAVGQSDSPRDSVNSLYGIMTGRQFSTALLSFGWNIRQIAWLQNSRFSVNGNELIGRDILTAYHGLRQDTVRDIIGLVALNDGKRIHIEFEGFYVESWFTDSGKRTRYGLPCDGSMVTKSHKAKQYKRNRRNNF